MKPKQPVGCPLVRPVLMRLGASKMTYTIARLIIWNTASYDRAQIVEAVVYVLGSLGARREDVDQATMLL